MTKPAPAVQEGPRGTRPTGEGLLCLPLHSSGEGREAVNPLRIYPLQLYPLSLGQHLFPCDFQSLATSSLTPLPHSQPGPLKGLGLGHRGGAMWDNKDDI